MRRRPRGPRGEQSGNLGNLGGVVGGGGRARRGDSGRGEGHALDALVGAAPGAGRGLGAGQLGRRVLLALFSLAELGVVTVELRAGVVELGGGRGDAVAGHGDLGPLLGELLAGAADAEAGLKQGSTLDAKVDEAGLGRGDLVSDPKLASRGFL